MRAQIRQCCIAIGAVVALGFVSVGCIDVDMDTDMGSMPLAADDSLNPVERLVVSPGGSEPSVPLPSATGYELTNGSDVGPADENGPRMLMKNILAEHLAVDNDFLCWSIQSDVTGGFGSAVYGLNLLGGKSIGVTEQSQSSQPMDIAMDDESLYWVDFGDGRVLKAALDGGRVTLLAVNQAGPYSIAVDDYYVYWTNLDDGTVKRASKLGNDVVELATGQAYPGPIAVLEGRVYWGNLGDGTLNAVLFDGRDLQTLVSGQTFSSEIVAEGKRLYWSNAMQRAIMQVGVDEEEARPLVSAQYEPAGIASDGDYIYWVTQADGTIHRVKKDGSTPEILATEQALPNEIAVDGLRVYWTNTGDASVMYLVK